MTNLRTFSLTNTPEYEINFLKYLKNVITTILTL